MNPHPQLAPRNSILIQHLCSHIANLQQQNIKLHQQISKTDRQKQIVCITLGKNSWYELLDEFNRVKNKQNGNNKENIGAWKDMLQDTSSTCKSNIYRYGDNTAITLGRQITPIRTRKQQDQSILQSPIQSQSRLLNRSIRGDTYRQQSQQVIQQNTINTFNPLKPLNTNISNQNPQNLFITLNNLAIHSLSKQPEDNKEMEQQNMLLSIQNTKLRQRIAKLQAIVSSRQYY